MLVYENRREITIKFVKACDIETLECFEKSCGNICPRIANRNFQPKAEDICV